MVLWGVTCCLKLSGMLLGVHGVDVGGDGWGFDKDAGGSRLIGGDCTWGLVGSEVECMRGILPGASRCGEPCGRLLGRVGSAA